jgi:serine/threonine-protein kinase
MGPKPDLSKAETVASHSLTDPRDPEISRITSSSEDEGRFLPGTLLGGRYRILSLLGRGGMGEVYRATDLTLGQSVALKFLPEEAARNQRLLERFHGEVRVARMVSHPNVCRVYDIGEVEGMPFISMEYVDGEDLSSLLTRIGRLPGDKAVDTARKICSGLAAAHDRGIIHRDLKPQNIMMNKRGEVVIMDFGLAAIADELTGAEARHGTPAYMSPEQLKGSAITSRSDIYALGLVLYELFTGKRPYDAKSVQQLLDMQESAQLTSMTSVAADIDAAVEKIIRRCLDPDPARRPATALIVQAALPGGDPLSAALAAGETPSPEMVAAAGEFEGMRRRYGVACLLATALCIAGTVPIRVLRTGIVHGGLDQPPEVLAHQGREIASSFGYLERPAETAVWLEHRGDVLHNLRRQPGPRNWDRLLSWEPAIQAVYRESPDRLMGEPFGYVDTNHPPQLTPGMTRTTVDGNGRLLDFSAVALRGVPGLAPAVSPETVFRAARLDPTAFSETTPLQTPILAFDQWRAWKGPHPHLANTELQLEAAWWQGRIVRVRVLYPWQQTAPGPSTSAGAAVRLSEVWIPVLEVLAAFFIIVMARHNWIKERADRQGAFRIAVFSLLLQALIWVGSLHPVAGLRLFDLTTAALADWVMGAVTLFLSYLALEPEIRARWPHAIVTWNRVLAGNWLDARVSSDILIGASLGCGLWIFFKAVLLFVDREPANWDLSLQWLSGTRPWVGAQAATLQNALSAGLFAFLTIFAMRQLFRREILAALASAVLYTLTVDEVMRTNWLFLGLLYATVFAALAFVLIRCGLVATVSAVYFLFAINGIILGTDWRAWYVPASLATAAVLLGIVTFAFWRSLGGRELLDQPPG